MGARVTVSEKVGLKGRSGGKVTKKVQQRQWEGTEDERK